ncbi:hypothetical protein QYF36_003789 [Acer negundo]|nr:hypothetical protein QYF36_003789 [Acer negundo]
MCDLSENVWDWATKFVDDFRVANNHGIGNSVVDHLEVVKRQCPESGTFKLNIDAALLATQMKVGLGLIIRDVTGKVMGSSIQPIFATISLQATEAMAIHQGIIFAVESGNLPLMVESDAKGVGGGQSTKESL